MLNPHQVRHLTSTFTYVDSLLQAVERVARGDPSPFAPEQPDIAQEEARLLESFIAILRTRMVSVLDRLGIARPERKRSARWTAETTLNLAGIALSELGSENLRGYGEVDEVTASELAALATDLRAILTRTRLVLREHDAGGLASALAAIPGPVGALLREVDRVSRERALAEVRPLLAAAVERASSGTFDVGVFGRVSSGKSSLINALIGADILPVGATPVTAVPVRLTRGASGAIVHLLDERRASIPIERIADYATEERNPENRAGVQAIEVTAPTVPEGLRLLDTPGVGSLGTSGPALAFKWLPRCDLGLVLVAAGGAVGRDELALIAGLDNAGIGCSVLLSKADLVSSEDRARAIEYVRRELIGALGSSGAVDVRAISIVPGAEAGVAAFRTAVLAPLARDHADAAKRALADRLQRLVRSTAAALAGRRRGVDERTMRLQRARTDAMNVIRTEAAQIDAAGPAILETASRAVVAAWRARGDGRDATRGAILQAAGDALGTIRHAIDAVRAEAGSLERDARRVPPLFDPELVDALPPLPPPPVARQLIGLALARRRLEPIARPLAQALQRYASRLYAWGSGALEELDAAAWDAPTTGAPEALPPELGRLGELLAELEPPPRAA